MSFPWRPRYTRCLTHTLPCQTPHSELQSTVAAAAGTGLADPGGNDHGGQVSLNNDHGFPRIFMGIHEESSGITLNHTGQKGIAIAAGPLGGIITTHDKDGHIVESLTGFDPDGDG